ncbi:MAG: phage baseplate assembly protein V [Humidesulfovibrio sp.]
MQKLLEPVRRRVATLVNRAVLQAVNDAGGLQELQVQALADEVMDRIERFQQYGLTSVPLAGAECVVLSVGGSRSNAVIIAVDDRRYRLQGLQGGEVALYTLDDQEAPGHRIVLKRGGVIEVRGRVVDMRGEELLRLSGGEVEIHADTRLETDVAGYGEALNFVDGVWRQDTYHTGATFAPAIEHGIQPPEVE